MRQRIVINSTHQEARVALLENETLVEIHIERAQQRNVAGNIYLGRVNRILPGMQAAFVDIGLEKAGFIHASDVFGGPLPPGMIDDSDEQDPDSDELLDDFDLTDPESEFDEEEESPSSTEHRPARGRRRSRSESHIPLEQKLKENQEILVQVAKEPIGTKGPRLTAHLSLPGRQLVYTPTIGHIGVSRRIADSKERSRLREAVASLRPAEGGFIVRTACEGLTKKEIHDDMKFLLKLWGRITKKREQHAAPALVHDDMDVILRIIRDVFTPDINEIIIDNANDYERINEFITTFMPRLTGRVKLHDKQAPIFEHYKIEPQITKALDRRVPLKSGGHIVIDHTEALTAIDVNTGRFVGKRNQEETMLQTNLEAAQVVVEQLRLRNIGGLIIVDFIDMERAANRTKVTEALRAALRKDKTRSNMRKISELGLVQMTRKRTRESLQQQLCAPCAACDGRGHRRSVPTITYNLIRQLHKEVALQPHAQAATVYAHPDVLAFLYEEEEEWLDALEAQLNTRFFFRADSDFHIEQYEIEITEKRPTPKAKPKKARPKKKRTTPRKRRAAKRTTQTAKREQDADAVLL